MQNTSGSRDGSTSMTQLAFPMIFLSGEIKD